MPRSALTIASLVLMATALAACGTVEGIGRDISDASVAVRNMFR